MQWRMAFAIVVSCLAGHSAVHAGLYNRAEPPPPLDNDLGKFLGTLAELRSYGPPDFTVAGRESRGRKEYLEKVSRLRSKGRLSAEEQANLGAYLIRLRRTTPAQQDYQEATQALEAARRESPRDFYVLANLATAHQLTGNAELAQSLLTEAAALAPPNLREFERYHLLLLRLRGREKPRPGLAPLDELFPARFVGDNGQWQTGTLAAAERNKLPPNALGIVQQLLVWLPDDGRLLWLFGELANARGDVGAAHQAMDQAVNVFRLSTSELKARRLALKEAVARLKPAAPDLATLIPDESAADTPPPPLTNPFANMGWQGWLVVALGGALIFGLTAMQLREILRRRAMRIQLLNQKTAEGRQP